MENGDIKTIIIATNCLISSYYVPDCAAYSTWIISIIFTFLQSKYY